MVPSGCMISQMAPAGCSPAKHATHERRDGDLRGAGFFQADSFPIITFKSTKVTPGSDKNKFKVDGNLTIHGITRPVTPADIARGRQLFEGRARFAKGAPPCLGCHSASNAGFVGGGRLGPDLTGAAGRLGKGLAQPFDGGPDTVAVPAVDLREAVKALPALPAALPPTPSRLAGPSRAPAAS